MKNNRPGLYAALAKDVKCELLNIDILTTDPPTRLTDHIEANVVNIGILTQVLTLTLRSCPSAHHCNSQVINKIDQERMSCKIIYWTNQEGLTKDVPAP